MIKETTGFKNRVWIAFDIFPKDLRFYVEQCAIFLELCCSAAKTRDSTRLCLATVPSSLPPAIENYKRSAQIQSLLVLDMSSTTISL